MVGAIKAVKPRCAQQTDTTTCTDKNVHEYQGRYCIAQHCRGHDLCPVCNTAACYACPTLRLPAPPPNHTRPPCSHLPIIAPQVCQQSAASRRRRRRRRRQRTAAARKERQRERTRGRGRGRGSWGLRPRSLIQPWRSWQRPSWRSPRSWVGAVPCRTMPHPRYCVTRFRTTGCSRGLHDGHVRLYRKRAARHRMPWALWHRARWLPLGQ